MLFNKEGMSSEIKKEAIRFSSESAHIKKSDGILRLSGNVNIEYGQYRLAVSLCDDSSVEIIDFKVINS